LNAVNIPGKTMPVQPYSLLSLFRLILSLLLPVICWSAQANCVFHNGSGNVMQEVTIPTLTVDAHPAADTVLWDSGIISSSVTTDILCLTAATIETGYLNDKTPVSGLATPYVYQTNIPGIGIAIYTSKDMQTLVPIQWPRYAETAEAGDEFIEQHYFRVRLVATGQPISSGMLILYGYEADRTFGTIRQFLLSFNPTLVQVQTSGCDIETKDINVPLTPGGGASINSLSRSGDTTSPVDFGINLHCDENTDFSLKFSGNTAGQQDILALDNPDQPDSAQGIGVQILFQDQPVSFNQTRQVWTTAHTQQVTVPFQAQVIRLYDRSSLRGGNINATATFEMVYR